MNNQSRWRSRLLMSVVFALAVLPGAAQSGPISDDAYLVLTQRTAANQAGFLVYADQDSGPTMDFPRGFSAILGRSTSTQGALTGLTLMMLRRCEGARQDRTF